MGCMTRQCAILLAIALGACPGAAPAPLAPAIPPDATPTVSPDAPPPPLPLDEDLPRLADRSVALYEEVARAFAIAGKDCAAAATTLRAMQPAYADVVAANAKVLHAGGARALRDALDRFSERFDAAAKSIATSTTMAECQDDREFTDAFDRLVGAP
jgi:hypothetical protein